MGQLHIPQCQGVGAVAIDQSPRLTDRSSLKECFRLEITDLTTNPAQI